MIWKAVLDFYLHPLELPATLRPIEPKTDIPTAKMIFWNWYDFMIKTDWDKLNEIERILGGQRKLLSLYLQGELLIFDLAGESWEAVRSDLEKCGITIPRTSAQNIEIPFDVRRQMTIY